MQKVINSFVGRVGIFKYIKVVLCYGSKWDCSCKVSEMNSRDGESKNFVGSSLNIAKVGSKNRVCLPPTLVNHLGVQPKDNVVWLLRFDKDGKPYAYMHGVKENNFKINDEEINTIEDTFKK